MSLVLNIGNIAFVLHFISSSNTCRYIRHVHLDKYIMLFRGEKQERNMKRQNTGSEG